MRLFEKINQQAMTWVKDMMEALPTADENKAIRALRAGLQALRDRLTTEEVAQLSAQLPLLIRGMFFEGWDPTDKPLRLRHKAEFLALVQEKCAPRVDIPADDIVAALFRVLAKHVSSGEVTQIVLSLPKDLLSVVVGERAEHAETF